MTASQTLLQIKYRRIIAAFSRDTGLSLDHALDFFYHSQVYELMREGISDYHCMSDTYLTEDLQQEWQERQRSTIDFC